MKTTAVCTKTVGYIARFEETLRNKLTARLRQLSLRFVPLS
jgi:hypothetical protein